ncbi:MmcQ/YjbR family DNA-binding protein [Geodermatophilus sp. YIM 151500]|uniref:MmcQ/YjbR family DNA-binding protein n=1 Tax=Geodermatophilus sp. YIM 151500 TaxID=2984531 RepID=UPI0021E3C06F|nr:MmcQ/YjbR family DNA-binding protein [Geodermatophilus sp. YIM 151500]MCV2489417.1 MmcQ/YjbR family DNA-binding protein [Geodermatophilus sp. YIM 151500]
MATWDDVARICAALPGTTEVESRGLRQWRVGDRLYLWERPLRPRDRAELGAAAPTGPVLGARVPDEGAKHALVADDPAVYFTTAHFDGYPAVLARLDELDVAELAELAGEAWACRAPKRLLAERGPARP